MFNLNTEKNVSLFHLRPIKIKRLGQRTRTSASPLAPLCARCASDGCTRRSICNYVCVCVYFLTVSAQMRRLQLAITVQPAWAETETETSTESQSETESEAKAEPKWQLVVVVGRWAHWRNHWQHSVHINYTRFVCSYLLACC